MTFLYTKVAPAPTNPKKPEGRCDPDPCLAQQLQLQASNLEAWGGGGRGAGAWPFGQKTGFNGFIERTGKTGHSHIKKKIRII